MKIVIVGCGRVGSTLAENLDADGHEVIIFDVKTAAFDRLPATFKGAAVRGDGTDEEVLHRNGADGADIFLALTEGDNRNVMAAQVATETLAVTQVIAKINDPVRAAAYAELGVVTLCRTNLMVDTVAQYLKLPMATGPGIDTPEIEGNRHPHPTAGGLRVSQGGAGDETPISNPAPGPRHGPEAGPSSPSSAPAPEVEASRAQRLGFRRHRG
jgi:trk system potassium uptake protein